jgi:DNA polymerase III delta prime subunit
MNLITQHFDKNNLHHAYLIEGIKEEILPELLNYIEELDIKTNSNPDFCHLTIDNFKKKEALDLRSMGSQKSFSSGKKIFLLAVNRFNVDSQGILLKIFEEPIENTHFFIITPSVDGLLKTFISRFYLIKSKSNSIDEIKNAKLFISMSLQNRIDFIKTNIIKTGKEENDTEEENVSISSDSNQSRALKFLDSLEQVFSEKIFSKKEIRSVDFFDQIFKAREFCRQPGASAKTLLESVALTIPTHL